jgi:hypothetical protein
MQKSRSIHLLPFAFLLITLILISAISGTVLWAKPDNTNKPDNKGKPSSDLVEANFKIWIGNGDLGSPEDVVLQPYGDPEMDCLLAEDWVGGDWVPPSTKSRAQSGGWGITLGRVNMGNTAASYCGTYDINDQSLLDALNLQGDFEINNQDVYMLNINRETKALLSEDDHKATDVDYWRIVIVWETERMMEVPNPWGEPDPMIVPHHYILDGKTNMNLEPEGVYDENTDTWTVTFDTVFELFENTGEIDDEGWDILNNLWEGPLSFTVEIQRILP